MRAHRPFHVRHRPREPGEAATGTAAYYDFNNIGSVVGITGSSGTYVNTYSYLPFGVTTTLTATLSNPFTYVGALGVLNDGTGLLNMRARSYDSTTGDFISPAILPD